MNPLSLLLACASSESSDTSDSESRTPETETFSGERLALRDNDEDGYFTCRLIPGTPTGGPTPRECRRLFLDCNDFNAEIHPFATETPYDSLNNDCNAATPDDDLDGDGFLFLDGSDCDDGSDLINPDAEEVCDDIDNNCNSAIDEDLPTSVYYLDEDSDGFGNPLYWYETCMSDPEGYSENGTDCNDADAGASTTQTLHVDGDYDDYGQEAAEDLCTSVTPMGYSSVSTDCDDSDSAVNPDAAEVCDSLDIDENCNGFSDDADPSATGQTTLNFDSDGDNYGTTEVETVCDHTDGFTATNSTDCDDADDTVNPAAVENNENFGDENCDNDAVTNLSEAFYTRGHGNVFDGMTYDEMGVSIASAGPVTGGYGVATNDAIDDTIVGAPQSSTSCATYYGVDCPGNSFILPGGGPYGWDTSAFIMLSGENDNDNAGAHVAGNFDFDGDGIKDVAVGADFNDDGGTNAGKAYIQLGPIMDDVDLGSASVQLIGETAGDYAGSLANAGDTDGDGDDEVLVAAPISSRTAPGAGAIYLVDYSATGTIDLSSSAAIITGKTSLDYLGAGYGADVDGDGISDLVLGANNAGSSGARTDPGHPSTTYYEGESYVFLGPVSGTVPASDADHTYVGQTAGQRSDVGSNTVNGDADGDGYKDMLFSAGLDPENGTAAGAVYLVYGPPSSSSTTLSASLGAKMLGENAGEFIGNATFVDPDNDGISAVLIGAPYAERAYMLRDPSGTIDLGDATAWSGWIFDAESTGDDPSAVTGAGDVDNDGYPDIAIGDPGNSAGGGSAGSAYLFFGSGF